MKCSPEIDFRLTVIIWLLEMFENARSPGDIRLMNLPMQGNVQLYSSFITRMKGKKRKLKGICRMSMNRTSQPKRNHSFVQPTFHHCVSVLVLILILLQYIYHMNCFHSHNHGRKFDTASGFFLLVNLKPSK